MRRFTLGATAEQFSGFKKRYAQEDFLLIAPISKPEIHFGRLLIDACRDHKNQLQLWANEMQNHNSVNKKSYNPNHMLNELKETMCLDDDIELARRLNVAPRIVTMMREGRISVSTSMLLWMQEASGMSLQELRGLLKDKCATYPLTCK